MKYVIESSTNREMNKWLDAYFNHIKKVIIIIIIIIIIIFFIIIIIIIFIVINLLKFNYCNKIIIKKLK
jgi:hypothetical protein